MFSLKSNSFDMDLQHMCCNLPLDVPAAKIQISLHICAVQSESSLDALWITKNALFLGAANEDSSASACWFESLFSARQEIYLLWYICSGLSVQILRVISRPRWLSWMRHPTGDQEVAGSTPVEVGNILSWRLIMKYFLWSFSPFCWFKKGVYSRKSEISGSFSFFLFFSPLSVAHIFDFIPSFRTLQTGLKYWPTSEALSFRISSQRY